MPIINKLIINAINTVKIHIEINSRFFEPPYSLIICFSGILFID